MVRSKKKVARKVAKKRVKTQIKTRRRTPSPPTNSLLGDISRLSKVIQLEAPARKFLSAIGVEADLFRGACSDLLRGTYPVQTLTFDQCVSSAQAILHIRRCLQPQPEPKRRIRPKKGSRQTNPVKDALRIRIAKAMGPEHFKAADAVERLRELGQLPNSKKLQSYISMVLSTSPVFKRVRWGTYKVDIGELAEDVQGDVPPNDYALS